MALYHLQSGFVSRSSGRSSVQSAAYITGADLHESRRNLDVSYKNRHSDIAFTDTLAPEHAPSQFHDLGVWDILENFEDKYAIQRYKTEATQEAYLASARSAQTIVMALPKELSVEASKELVEAFAKERFVSRGLIVTYAIHDDEGNPHAHLLISRRAVNEKGELAWAKDREIVTRKELLVTRKLWADLTNKYLEIEGFDEEIVNELRTRAKNSLLTQAMASEEDLRCKSVSKDLMQLPGMDKNLALKLADRGIVTRDDLAELAVDDLTDIPGLDASKAAELIMAARAHWFV